MGLTVIGFLQAILGDACGWICLAKIDRANSHGFSQTFIDYPLDLRQIVSYIKTNNTFGVDLYFCPTLFSKPERKKEYVLPARALWADLDNCSPSRLGKYGEPKPNIIVQTSKGRWQAYWLLDTSTAPEKVEALNKRIAVGYKQYGCDQGGWDLSQLLRLPAKNWKYYCREKH